MARCAPVQSRARTLISSPRTDMGRMQGEHHVRSHRLLGTRRRYPDRRGNARRRRSVDRHLEVLEPPYGLRCPTPLAAAASRRASRLALRAPSAPALRTCLLARLPPPSGLVSALQPALVLQNLSDEGLDTAKLRPSSVV